MIKNRFYMTYARSRAKDIVPLCEKHDIGLMTNAAHRWSEATESFNHLWDYECPHIVDSGGYNVQSSFGKYPWGVEEYHNWIKQYGEVIDWVACMDYACEERFDELHSVSERMDMTIDNTIAHYELDPKYNVLPVLQGRSVDQYIESYEALKAQGIPLANVGLGTVCRISSSDEILRTEQAVREACGEIENIHGFGVKIDAYRRGATFESADSQAWVYAASNGKCYVQNGDGLTTIEMSDNSRKRTIWSFVNYYDYVSSLSENFPNSTIDTILCNLDGHDKSESRSEKQEDIKQIAEAIGVEVPNSYTREFLQDIAVAVSGKNIQ